MARDSQHNTGGFWSHVFTVPNMASVLIGLVVFWLIADNWRSSRGTAGAALLGSLVTAAVWIIWMRATRARRLENRVDEPVVAFVPVTQERSMKQNDGNYCNSLNNSS